ncbi:MAG: hypothetical protein JXA09_13940 [Anaerolineae bacterium]|nr:hypothetical protein [Anaerolineae bacterium]
MDHIQILKRAAQVVWKYRALWVIGLLLVLAGGGVGGAISGAPGSPGGGGDGEGTRWERTYEGWHDLDQFWADVGPLVIAIGVVLLVVMGAMLLLGVVRVVLRYVTRTSLIRMVDQYEVTGEEVGGGSGLRMGWSRASFRLFLLNLLIKLPIALVALVLVIPLIALALASFANASGTRIALGVAELLLLIPIVLLAALLGIAVQPLLEIAYRATVLEDIGAWPAVKSAFGLIRRNFGAVALQWLLLVGLGIAWGIALVPINLLLVLLGLMVGGVPGTLVGGLAGLIGGWPWGVGAGSLVFLPLFLALVVLPNIAMSTAATVYHSTVWTLAYREIRALDEAKAEGNGDELEVAPAGGEDESA